MLIGNNNIINQILFMRLKLSLLLMLFLSLSVAAQTGLRGVVIDSRTNVPVAGATVLLDEQASARPQRLNSTWYSPLFMEPMLRMVPFRASSRPSALLLRDAT